MEIAKGVHLHVIQTPKFKTNHITLRFSGRRNRKNLACRVLVAQMLATANATYPTVQAFRAKLASLYGANLSTKLSTKGKVHMVDIDISFISDHYTLKGEKLLEEVLEFLKDILDKPLVSIERYQHSVFDVEKANLLSYLESDEDDSFYHSERELQKLFYTDEDMRLSKYASLSKVHSENSFTAFQEFQRMLREDVIDIFVVGDQIDDYRMLQYFHRFSFSDRTLDLNFYYKQDYSNMTRQRIEKRQTSQSVLQLAYHFPLSETPKDHFALIVLNGILGAFSHSLLFMRIRESEGLAYSIGSQFDAFSGLLKVYAGIDRVNRNKTIRIINKTMNELKMARLSSDIIQQTKQMLITNATLSSDSPHSLIELHYHQAHLGTHYKSVDSWIDKVDKVSKEDIVRMAGKLKLQSLYFLEGE